MRAIHALAAIGCAWSLPVQAHTPHETAQIMAQRILTPDHRVLTNRGPVVMSDNPAPEEGTPDSAGAGIADAAATGLAPPDLLPPMVGVTALDAGFPEFADALLAEAGRQMDAGMADELLASIGRVYRGRMALLTHKVNGDSDPFHAKAPRALPGDDPDMTWDRLNNHNFGSARYLAVAVTNKFNGFSSMATNVQLQHTTGPVDVEVKVSGWQGLSMAQAMSLSYNSIALVDLNKNVKVGMTASGSLGTLGALTPAQDQVAGPVARFKLFGNGTSVSAETGYSFRMRQESDPGLNRFHANLNLNVKL
ncbi:hypothetical protein [Novosphingobium terrae]|uniref:hypothetical protein n=1 Tax=Novosphingobium terrae TaxID=2726189 RepID=UPI0019818001|nr:hypothetical protein [Novosphingobium terrae]